MINVLHVIDSLGVGGAERQLALTLSALDPQRVRSFVCYLHSPDDVEPAIRDLGIPVYRLDAEGKSQWHRAVLRLRRLVKSLDIDLIHTQLFDADVVGGLVGRITAVPVVSTLANSSYDSAWLIDNPSLSRFKLAYVCITYVIKRYLSTFINY